MLQVVESQNDLKVWDTMDEAAFHLLEKTLLPEGSSAQVEYWHQGSEQRWSTARPTASEIRVDGLVHEASTLWIGADDSAVVNLDYRLRGVENVFVTGGGLWPTGASWNPTMTMVALAQDLSEKLFERAGIREEVRAHAAYRAPLPEEHPERLLDIRNCLHELPAVPSGEQREKIISLAARLLNAAGHWLTQEGAGHKEFTAARLAQDVADLLIRKASERISSAWVENLKRVAEQLPSVERLEGEASVDALIQGLTRTRAALHSQPESTAR